jgi:hypothetical protein
VESELRQLCVSVLISPSDPCALERLLIHVEGQDSALASRLRSFLDTGVTEAAGYTRIGHEQPFTKVMYVVLRLVPKKCAVRFACACAERVLPKIEQFFPSELGFRELILVVQSWINDEATEDMVLAKLNEVQKDAIRLDREWETGLNQDRFNARTEREMRENGLAVVALDVILCAAGAVTAKNPACCIDCVEESAIRCIEVDEGTVRWWEGTSTKTWQLGRLAEYVRDANHVRELG